MTAERQAHDPEIRSLERAGLALVYGGPVWAWVGLARVVGVKVTPDAQVDDSWLSGAESGAHSASKWFTAALVATTVCMIAVFVLSPWQEALLEPYLHYGYHEIVASALAKGATWSAALAYAGAFISLIGLLAGLLNAVVFGGIPLFFLRNTAEAAAPAVSVALARRAGEVPAVSDDYPRVVLAVDTILNKRKRGWRR